MSITSGSLVFVLPSPIDALLLGEIDSEFSDKSLEFAAGCNTGFLLGTIGCEAIIGSYEFALCDSEDFFPVIVLFGGVVDFFSIVAAVHISRLLLVCPVGSQRRLHDKVSPSAASGLPTVSCTGCIEVLARSILGLIPAALAAILLVAGPRGPLAIPRVFPRASPLVATLANATIIQNLPRLNTAKHALPWTDGPIRARREAGAIAGENKA
mmetsp:Transcript_12916/g.19352  ORF Transcript_12916/g.19352 Transcript_12916/m.19352 type:complete len:211 (+) Transcript_12916:2590-3222(+)